MSINIKNIRKILIINTFGIGDVLFTTPLIANLKDTYPEIEIGYVANKRTSIFLENDPRIKNVYVYERDYFNFIWEKSKKEFYKESKDLLQRIKSQHYDSALDLSLNPWNSMFSFFAGIKLRIGFNYKNRGRFLTHKIDLAGYENKHVVEYYFDLLRFIGLEPQIKLLEFYLKDADILWVESYFKENNISTNKPVICIVPGGGASWGKSASNKRWEPQNYAKLADKLVEKYNASIILNGDKNELELCQVVARQMKNKAQIASGKTSIGQFAALLKRCNLAVVNDGGPLHIAVAAGCPTVSIFGPVNEIVYGPYGETARHSVVASEIPCRPCYRNFRMANCEHLKCIREITVNQVFGKVEKLL